MNIPHMFQWNWKKSSDVAIHKKRTQRKSTKRVNVEYSHTNLEADQTFHNNPIPTLSNNSNFSLPALDFTLLQEPTTSEPFSFLALLTEPISPAVVIDYNTEKVIITNNKNWDTSEDSTHCLSTTESKALMDRIQFFILPSVGECALNIELTPASPKYNHTRVKEAKTLIEKNVVLRMNLDSAKIVTWRQNLCFTLPHGPIADLFFSQLTETAPTSIKYTSKHYSIEGKSSKGLQLETRVYKWNEDNMPSLKSEHWYMKKWNGKNNLFRARCIEFSLTYRPQLDIVRVEFQYQTQKWNDILKAWQDV